MNELQQRMTAFLNETIEYYAADPVGRRCVRPTWKGGGCFYDPRTVGKEATSKGCAIGRRMTPEQRAAADGEGGVSLEVGDLDAKLLPAELAGMPMGFLQEVQQLHDGESNWTATDLSDDGEALVRSIRSNIAGGYTECEEDKD